MISEERDLLSRISIFNSLLGLTSKIINNLESST